MNFSGSRTETPAADGVSNAMAAPVRGPGLEGDDSVVEVKEAYARDWVAGVCGGGSGTNVHLRIQLCEGVKLMRFFYAGRSAPLTRRKDGVFVARFAGKANGPEELMERWGGRVGGGPGDPGPPRPPPVQEEEVIPYDLADGEAVITYTLDEEPREVKIRGVETRPMIPYM